jgi:nitrogen fixation protein NifU and related proteins
VFSDEVMDHVLNPRNVGPLAGATHTGLVGVPGEGKYIKIELALEGSRILRAAYQCNGCPASIASASVVCQIACGKLVEIGERISPSDVILILRGLPEGKEDAAAMAVNGLKLAIQSPLGEARQPTEAAN